MPKENELTHQDLEKISKETFHGLIHPQGLAFIFSSIEYVTRNSDSNDVSLGVRELCEGVRDFAAKEYGLMAKEVLEEWGIDSTRQIGRIIFAFVENGFMKKTDEDSLEDFERVFDFEKSFQPDVILRVTRDSRPRNRKK